VPRGRRRYHDDKCKKRLEFTLSLATSLIRALNVRFAAFSYTEKKLILDVLPKGSDVISRFIYPRTPDEEVHRDFLRLVCEAGKEWHQKNNATGSRWRATMDLLKENACYDIPPHTIIPTTQKKPVLNSRAKTALKLLKLTKEQLMSSNNRDEIKSAYRKKALKYHPDKGGNDCLFIKINEAHAELLQWIENPKYQRRRTLKTSWCYDASRRRWSPPYWDL